MSGRALCREDLCSAMWEVSGCLGGLAAADQLNKMGHRVTVLERADRVGGVALPPQMKSAWAVLYLCRCMVHTKSYRRNFMQDS